MYLHKSLIFFTYYRTCVSALFGSQYNQFCVLIFKVLIFNIGVNGAKELKNTLLT